MIFKKHTSSILDTHAFLSGSNGHWVNYTEDKLARMYNAHQAAKRGSELHAFAAQAIRLGIRLPDAVKTLNMYVNDAIGYKLTPEQMLYFSHNCYGTADAIGFRQDILRIHDLKTGITETSPTQLEIYAAIFALEYRVDPLKINMEFRIYQDNNIRVYPGDPDRIIHIMDKIRVFDKLLTQMRLEGV